MKGIRWAATAMVVCAMSFLVLSSSSSPVSAQTTLVVDDDGQGSATDCDATDVAYSTIQAAVTAAASDDTILVCPGTYTETGQIVISKNLSLVGAGAGSTIIKPAGDTGSSGDARGWFLVNSGITFDLSGVTLDGTGRKVWQAIRHKGQGTVSDCAFTNIKFEESGPSYAGTGIAAFGTPAMNVNVTNCAFTGIGRVGVLYFGSGITSSTFSGNTYTGKGAGDWLDYGVEVGGGAHATITRNTISANTGVASVDGSTSAGIVVTTYYGAGTTATITENFISDSTVGIAVGYNEFDTSVVTANFNSITGNTVGVDSTAPTVDATGNWWGSDTGPSHALNPGGTGDAVSDNVAYSPWLGIGTDASGDPGFQPVSPMTYIVGPDVCLALGCIQQAVNLASAGDTLDVKAGTYNEQVVIDKSLVVDGAGQGVTVVAPSPVTANTTRPGGGSVASAAGTPVRRAGPLVAALAVTADAASAGIASAASAGAGIIVVDGATDVTIQDLTVDGAGNGITSCSTALFGVYWRNASGTLEGSEVRNIELGAGLEGCQDAVGILAESGDGGSTTVTIDGNYVHDVQKGGIVALGSATTADISGNTVVGWGPTDKIAQNGIQLSFGAAGSITGNEASLHDYTPSTWAATGILVHYAADGVTVSGNQVHDNMEGIFVVNYSTPTMKNVEMSGNTVADTRDTGVFFLLADDATVSGTTISGGAYGLWIADSNGASVHDSTIENNDHGIIIDGSSTNASIYVNDILSNSGSSASGIHVECYGACPSGIEVHFNNIVGNSPVPGAYGIYNDTTNVVDATGNWWGSDTGPSHALNPGGTGDAVSDNVAYSPWLGIGTDASGDPGFQPVSPMTYIVGPDVCLPVGCIQQAVDLASDGDTIRVKEGTYTEQVVVDGKNNLTIEDFGSPKPKVTVGPGATGAIIHVWNSSNVTIDGLEVDGAGNGASPCPASGGPDTDQRFYGIRYSDSSGTVRDNEVHGIDYPTICGSGVGIYAYESDVLIEDNVVYDCQKNGITANLAGTSSIHDNTVTGWGPSPDIAQNGIQVAFGATGTVQGNTVSAISYTGDYWAGSGILVTSYADWGYPPSYADATSNTVTDAQVGIYYGEGSGTIDGNVVSASAAGVGLSEFWGIIVSDPADHAPSPFEDAGAAPPAAPPSPGPGVMTVVVSGNTVTGDGSADSVGLEVDAGYGPEDVDLTASDNTISNWGTGVLVSKCTEDCDTGVFLSVDIGPDNDISGNDNGVFLDSVAGVVISGNEIHHNVNRPGSAGVGVMLWGDNDNNQILDNVIHDNDRQGIFIGHCDFAGPGGSCTDAGSLISTGNLVKGNVIYNNGLNEVGPPDPSRYGVQLWNADFNTVDRNEVYNHQATPGWGFALGVYLCAAENNTVSNNNLHDNRYNIGVYGCGSSSAGNTMTGNEIRRATDVGIRVWSNASTTRANFNNIVGNANYGVRNTDTTGTVNAENNWWGACDGPGSVGPGSGDKVSEYVDYEPWVHGACDYDGDKLSDDQERLVIGTDWLNPDTDGDGCDDGREYVAMEGFEPLVWYDFYDVPTAAMPDPTPNGPKNQAVAMDDVLAVLFYVGTFDGDGGSPNANGVAYDSVKGSCDWNADTAPDKEGLCYDRSPSLEPNPPWDAGPPDSAVSMDDVLALLAQTGLSCAGGP